MSQRFDGLPLDHNPKHPSLLYEGVEYKKFWVGRERQRLDEWEHYLVRQLLPTKGYRLVDIGCGFGRLTDCYLDRFEQVIMVDGSKSLLREAQDSFKDRALYIAADANHLPFASSSFDCVLMIRVFQHLWNSALILSELGRILESAGTFLFNFSNKLSARQLLRRLLRWNNESPCVLEPVISSKTLIQHHPAYVHRLLRNTGFSDMQYFGAGVIDKLPGDLGRFERWRRLAMPTARTLGLTRLAPWVICRTQKVGGTLAYSKRIDDFLICPSCRSAVCHSGNSYVCVSCNKLYPIDDGIADFRPIS